MRSNVVAVVLALSAGLCLSATTDAMLTPKIAALANDATLKIWTESSLKRVFPKSAPGKSAQAHLTAARNQRLSFQICVRNLATEPASVDCEATDAKDLEVRVRRVGYVPMEHHTAQTDPTELDGFGMLPGLVPDPLFPETKFRAGTQENLSYWISIRVPEGIAPGMRDLTFRIKNGDKTVADVHASVDVRSFTIKPRHDFPVTHWWRPSPIYRFYKEEPWSDAWFATTEKYVRDMVDHGSNVLMVPTLEGRRELFKRPAQMVKVRRNGKDFDFDFSVVRRFVHMAREAGVEYFEWPHLWIYWGVKNAVPVYTEQDGKFVPMWTAEADGFSDEYKRFLKQYLDGLHEVLVDEKMLDKSFFHVSDEPNLGGPEAIQRYEKARAYLHEVAPWVHVLDALSDINYAKKGICDMPVPIVDTAKAYVDAGIPHWVYFCCGPRGANLNRFMDTPLAKIRMSGWLFYRLKAKGFLHWGYNYWDQMDTETLLDVFKRGDGGAWPDIPYGDPFVVYPGPDGPLDSIRWEVFAESLQDYALLQTAGISPDDPMLASIHDYADFPKSEKWIEAAIAKVLRGR